MLISRTAFSSATARDLRLHLGLALRLDEFQKTEQSLPLELIELLRQPEKPFNVRLPLRAARTRPQPLGVMRFRQHVFQALRQRHLPRQLPPARKPFEKSVDFRPQSHFCTPPSALRAFGSAPSKNERPSPPAGLSPVHRATSQPAASAAPRWPARPATDCRAVAAGSANPRFRVLS